MRIVLIILSILLCGTALGAPTTHFLPELDSFVDTRGPWSSTNGTPVIYIVDTLNWDDGQPPQQVSNYDGSGLTVYKGSLRRILSDYTNCAHDQGRIILFEVSGVIKRADNAHELFRLRRIGVGGMGYTWIAGQSAPPPGITLYNINLIVHDQHNIIQHIRFRLDDNVNCDQAKVHRNLSQHVYDTNSDGLPEPGFRIPMHNIVDHCTMTYAIDNIMSPGDYSLSSNNIFAYGLGDSLHPKTYPWSPCCISTCDYAPEHSKGLGITDTEYATVLLNLLAFNNDRNPYIYDTRHAYIANNLLYGSPSSYISFPMNQNRGAGDGPSTVSIIGNIIDNRSHLYTVGDFRRNGVYIAPHAGNQTYMIDNICSSGHQTDPNTWLCVRDWTSHSTPYDSHKVSTPIDTFTNFTPRPANQVKNYIMQNVGAFPAYRDQADIDLINHVRNNTGRKIDRPEDLSNPFPALAQNTRTLNTQMPVSVGPIPASPHADSDGDNYTNMHEWLLYLAYEVEGRNSSAPEVTITTTDPSNIIVDSLALAGYATDTVGEVATCKFRLGSAPDESNGTSLTLLESFPKSFDELIAGFSEGANTLYVGCDDNDDNWGSDSIVVNYTIVSADGCSQSEVQAAIDAIDEDGDVVTIPACDPNPAVWTTGVDSSTSFEFTIQGASEALTQIKYTGSGNVFDFTSPANDDNGFRGISNLTVMGNTVSGVYDGADNNTTTYIDEAGRDLSALGMGTGSFVYNSTDGCLGAVAAGGFSTTASTNDTVTFSTISGGTDGDFDDGDTVLLYLSRSGSETFLKAYTDSGNPELYIHDVTVGAFHTVGRIVGYHGVISDNTFTRPAWASAYGFYIEESSSYGWPLSDPSLGTRSSLFVEDNTFQGYCHAVSGFCGSRYVFRHNTRNEDARAGSGCGIDTHEGGYNTCWPTTTPELRHGGRLWEVYNNTFISGDVDEHNGLYQRSGIGLLTGNTFTNHHIGVTVLIDGNSRGPDCDITENCPVVNYVTATDCSDPGEGCCEPPTNVWIWGNTYNDVAIETQILPYNSCLSLDAANGPAVYDETPESVRDGFTWTPFTYPHPLRGLVGETKLSRTTLLRTSLGE